MYVVDNSVKPFKSARDSKNHHSTAAFKYCLDHKDCPITSAAVMPHQYLDGGHCGGYSTKTLRSYTGKNNLY